MGSCLLTSKTTSGITVFQQQKLPKIGRSHTKQILHEVQNLLSSCKVIVKREQLGSYSYKVDIVDLLLVLLSAGRAGTALNIQVNT